MNDTIYILNNLLGGVASFNSNLARQRPDDAPRQMAVLLTDTLDPNPQMKSELGADLEIPFLYSSYENQYAIFERLAAVLPDREGAIVSNGPLEMAMLSQHPVKQTVFQVVHDEFNMRLAKRFCDVIDVFIAHSRFFFERLRATFPDRADSIFHVPYGIRLAPKVRQAKTGPIRLVFLGRLTEPKGVLDLPLIEAGLATNGVATDWTIIGDGPLRSDLREAMPPSDRIRFLTPETNDEVLAHLSEGDIQVFPTRFEGFPVALLEAMSAGLVPVVSDLPSGVPEVVTEDAGYRIPIGDVEGFIKAIISIDADRSRLEAMSAAARLRASDYDVSDRAESYHRLFARAVEFKRPWNGPLKIKHGSRLDSPHIPNIMTIAAREAAARLKNISR